MANLNLRLDFGFPKSAEFLTEMLCPAHERDHRPARFRKLGWLSPRAGKLKYLLLREGAYECYETVKQQCGQMLGHTHQS